jgi:hypothetical protein
MVQLHLEDNYVVVVEVKVVDLVIATTKARAHDLVTLERPSNWTYSIFKELKTRVGSRKTTKKYS